MVRTVIRTLVAVLLSVLMMSCAAQAAWEIGTALPDLTASQLAGTLPDLKGKVVLVDFWASWCAPCKKSFPTLDALQQQHDKAGLIVLAISVDQSKAAMQKFLKSRDVSFATVWDAKQQLVKSAGVNAMPSSFLVDRKGNIRYMHVGYHGKRTASLYATEISKLLKEGK